MGGGVHKKAIQTHCKHSLFSVLAQPPSPPNCAQEPMRNLTEASTAKQNQQRQAPKGEIQNKICLRRTASPFNMLVRKFRKLKIAPPTRKGIFLPISILKKKKKMKKSIAQESCSQCYTKSQSCRTNFRTTALGHGKHWFP